MQKGSITSKLPHSQTFDHREALFWSGLSVDSQEEERVMNENENCYRRPLSLLTSFCAWPQLANLYQQ